MDTDILKPNTGYLTIIERPAPSSSKGTSDRQTSSGPGSPSGYAEPVSEGEEDEEMDLAPARDEDKRTGLTGEAYAEAVAHREQMLKERERAEGINGNGSTSQKKAVKTSASDEEGADERTALLRGSKKAPNGKLKAMSINPLAPSSAFDETLRDRLRGAQTSTGTSDTAVDREDEDGGEGSVEGPVGDDRVLTRDWRAPAGKRVSVPVRIEPKVYFAAERTFLVRFSLVLYFNERNQDSHGPFLS